MPFLEVSSVVQMFVGQEALERGEGSLDLDKPWLVLLATIGCLAILFLSPAADIN